jgi:hypothetical protein
VTDDVAAVQKAVNACASAGGGTVYMPAGTYVFHQGHTFYTDASGNANGGMVELRSGVYITGDGTGSTIIKGTYVYSLFVAANATNVGVSQLSAYNTDPGQTDIFKFAVCDGVALSHIIGHDVYAGVNLYGCTDSTVSNMVVYNMVSAGIATTEGNYEQTHGSHISFTDCEAYNCNVAFSVGGERPSGTYPSRLNDVTLTRCYGHDSHAAFRLTYASNLTLTGCTGAGSPYAPFNMFLANVATAHLTNCTPAHLVTSTSDHTDWLTYGGTDCTNIVQN